MKAKIEKILEAIVDMVDDTSVTAAEKTKLLKAACEESEYYATSLEEFVAYGEEALEENE